jgi:hypothetical protein
VKDARNARENTVRTVTAIVFYFEEDRVREFGFHGSQSMRDNNYSNSIALRLSWRTRVSISVSINVFVIGLEAIVSLIVERMYRCRR